MNAETLDPRGFRVLRIPQERASEKLIRAREARNGDGYPCVVCGLPMPAPKFLCHVIDGGGYAVHPDDDALYAPDGGDMGCQPVGTECLRKNPELKPYVFRA